MSWHYRVLLHADGSLALHEVYCDETGRPNGYTKEPITFSVGADEEIDGLVESLRMALNDAINRPVLNAEDMSEIPTAVPAAYPSESTNFADQVGNLADRGDGKPMS